MRRHMNLWKCSTWRGSPNGCFVSSPVVSEIRFERRSTNDSPVLSKNQALKQKHQQSLCRTSAASFSSYSSSSPLPSPTFLYSLSCSSCCLVPIPPFPPTPLLLLLFALFYYFFLLLFLLFLLVLLRNDKPRLKYLLIFPTTKVLRRSTED